jgi:hypothetical protein
LLCNSPLPGCLGALEWTFLLIVSTVCGIVLSVRRICFANRSVKDNNWIWQTTLYSWLIITFHIHFLCLVYLLLKPWHTQRAANTMIYCLYILVSTRLQRQYPGHIISLSNTEYRVLAKCYTFLNINIIQICRIHFIA